jgi:hypothetical protein
LLAPRQLDARFIRGLKITRWTVKRRKFPIKMETDLGTFLSGYSPKERVAALGRLAGTPSQIHLLVKDPKFDLALQSLLESVGPSGEEKTRLLAVAYVSKLAAVIKSRRKMFNDWLERALKEPLPPLTRLQDPDERAYVANACGVAAMVWCRQYLAIGAVNEESAENARLECLKSLISSCPDLETAVGELLRAWPTEAFETSSPAESAGRRMRRLFSGLRRAIAASSKEPGRNVGGVLAELTRSVFDKYGVPREQSVRRDLAEETLAVVHELIRSRFSLATDAPTFHPLQPVRGWMDEYRWKLFAASSKSAKAVASDLLEAITILAKQGKTDDVLRSYFDIAEGSRGEADKVLANFAHEAVGLSEDVRSWFLRKETTARRISPASGLATESQTARENAMLADLLVDAEDLFVSGKELAQTQGGRADGSAEDLRRYFTLGTALADAVRSFARRRQLELRGRKGDLVEYSAVEHELIGGERLGVRTVRIVRPAVAQLEGAIVRTIIRRALVEAA